MLTAEDRHDGRGERRCVDVFGRGRSWLEGLEGGLD